MRIILNGRDATVGIPSKTFISSDFLVRLPEKEVNQFLSIKKKTRKKRLLELQDIQKTFKSTFIQWLINPQLYRSHRIYAASFPLFDTSVLPEELVVLAYQAIAGLLVLIVLLGMIMSILVSGYHLINRGQEAEKWQKSIRKGVIQALLAPFVIFLLAFVVHYFLQGRDGYIPIFKSQP